jgi:type VI secretion system protein ImpF
MSAGYSDRSSIRISLLDRLLDDAPRNSQEVAPDDAEKLRIVQRSVRRDLECLLNTRYRCVSWPPELNQIDNSLINYGIPDFTSASLNAVANSDILVKAVKQAIDFFEPRLVDVIVVPVANDLTYDRTFRFRIEGTLIVEDGRHRIKFDTAMESATGQFEIK